MSSRSLRAVLFVVFVACVSVGSGVIWSGSASGSAALAASPAAGGNSWAPSLSSIIVYSQPPSLTGALLQSSWLDPNGSDADQYVWDDFTLSATHTITEVDWRGGYDPAKAGFGGPVLDFSVAIYADIGGDIQPDVISPPLVHYQTGGNAGETAVGMFNLTRMYDYTFALPVPFQADASVTYWLQIEAFQHGYPPDWGMAVGTGGNGKHFRKMANAGDISYQIVPGDAAFTLLGPPALAFRVYFPRITN